jgi:hypothetical protein
MWLHAAAFRLLIVSAHWLTTRVGTKKLASPKITYRAKSATD